MLLDLNQLQVVLIECPYDSLNSHDQSLFSATLALKLRGYGSEYPYGVLPVDTYDFIGSHHIVSRKRGRELVPIMAYRTVSLARCDLHRIPFPALALARASGADVHEAAVESILNRCRERRIQIVYGSSWTIDPEIRKSNRGLVSVLRDLMTAMQVHYHHDCKIPEAIGCGVIRFKTDTYFQSLGYQPLRQVDRDLPPIEQASLFGERVIMMHWPKINDYAWEIARKYTSFWEDRREVDRSQASELGAIPQKRAA